MSQTGSRDAYRLWWEYLKRSEAYNDYCRLKRTREASSLLDQLYKDDVQKVAALELTYTVLGDVHQVSFEEWWDRISDYIQYLQGSPEPIWDYKEIVERDMADCTQSFQKEYGCEPSLLEFKQYFTSRMATLRPATLYLLVDVTAAPTKSIRGTFAKVLKEAKGDPTAKVFERIRKRFLKPSDRLHLDEVSLYLKAYDLRKEGLKIGEIIKKIGNESQRENYMDEGVKRSFYRYLDKAERIISNVESGYFPGRYR